MSRGKFEESLENLRQLCLEVGGVELSWKDADPELWEGFPPHLSLHQSPYCLKVKGNLEHMKQCSEFDNLLLPLDGFHAVRRVCPFGVEEWSIPVHSESRYLGCLYLGPIKILAMPVKGDHDRNGTRREEKIELLKKVLEPWLPTLARYRTMMDFSEHTPDLVINQVISFIYDNLDRPISLSECAEAVHLSPSRLRHRFVASTGERLSGRIIRTRLAAVATDLLRFPNLKIKEIMTKWGWNDAAYFTKSFSRTYGMSPKKWRVQKSQSEA